jgi:hypothetical protein
MNAGRRLTVLLLCILAAPLAPSQTSPSSAQSKAQVQVTSVPPLLWLQRNQAAALLKDAHLRANMIGPENAVVIAQDPPAGKGVLWGTVVTVTLGQPRLSLSVNNPTAQINEDLTFTLALEPPFRSHLRFLFQWGDNTPAEWVEKPAAGHRFAAAGTYQVSAVAQVGQFQVPSNAVTVTIAEPPPPATMYTAELRAQPTSGPVGTPVEATVSVSPPTGKVTEYLIQWGDGAEDRGVGPAATHTYQTPGKRSIVAIVSVDGQTIHSNSVDVTIEPAVVTTTTEEPPPPQPTPSTQPTPSPPVPSPSPILPIAIGLAALLGLFTLIYFVRGRPGKPIPPAPTAPAPTLSVNATMGPVEHTIQHPEQIGTKLTVRVRGGIARKGSPDA